MVLAAGLGLAAIAVGYCRYAIDAFSRPRLLQSLPEDSPHRGRFDRYFAELDHTRIALAILWVVVDASFVLATLRAAAASLAPRAPFSAPVVLTGLGVATFFLVPLARLLPRTFAARRPEEAIRRLLPAFHAFGRLLWPLAAPLVALRRGLSRVLGLEDREALDEAFEEEIIATVAEGEQQGLVAGRQAELIGNVVQFRDVHVGEVMTPRTDMDWIDASETVQDALRFAAEKGHSRLPVADEDADHVIGVFYVRDVLHRFDEVPGLLRQPVHEMCRKAYFVPESKQVTQLLEELRAHKLHIAIVLDEYGGTAGLVTIEDIIEEIVGEIADEYDAEPDQPEVTVIDKDHIEVDARAHVSEVADALDVDLPESGDFDTIGGMVFSNVGRVPQVGETVLADGLEITVLDADERRVKRLDVRVLSREKATSE